jgi:hypothetical protein
LRPEEAAGAWNPGIVSPIPAELRGLCTIFRPENVFTRVETADELHDLTGIPSTELAAFRPQRLVLHELLVRVTADYAIADGSRIEDLGINFRQVVRVLLQKHIEPNMDTLVARFDALRQRLAHSMHTALATLSVDDRASSGARQARRGLFARLARRRVEARVPVSELNWGWDLEQIAACERRANAAADEFDKAVYRTLARLMSALFNRHGGAWGARDLVGSLATDLACNELGSDCIGQALEPLLQAAAAQEGYYRLPRQGHPIVLNTKGPSAAGKSSLRPLQKKLAGDIGARWSDFALISPDIWRKQLLDYQSLGAAYRYAGAMTADELQIVDQKLDRYMAHKHRRGEMSHLLIDRFRFDSFAPFSDEAGSNLLTRFGQTVYLFFVITPPDSLVERAWKRGLEFGRYKAVTDTLAHSVEAYAGMPDLFFTWVRNSDKTVHFEFLDNSVRFGERPRTVAFGDKDRLNVLDIKGMLDIERFRRVNVAASVPEQLYLDCSRLAPEHNTAFLQRCSGHFREVNFAEQATGRIYLRMVSGRPAAADRELLQRAIADDDTLAGVRAVAPAALDGELPRPDQAEFVQRASGTREATLGHWGTPGTLGVSACA